MLAWAWEACTEAAARRARAATRRRALATAIGLVGPAGLRADEQGDVLGPGGMTTLIGYGIDDLDPFVARVLPGAVLAIAVPALLLAWIGHLDLVSAGLAGVTLVIQRRRLAMARSLAGPAPRLWLLDEPTADLDQASARRLVTELGRIFDGVTAIIATHDPSAMTLGHRVIELSRGRVLNPGQLRPGQLRPGQAPAARVRAR